MGRQVSSETLLQALHGGVAPLAGQNVYASSKAAVSILTECLAAQLVAAETKLRAAIFYPSGGLLRTGIWTTKRNRPADLARDTPVPEGSETTFEEFMDTMKKVGIELPVQDLDELAAHALTGIFLIDASLFFVKDFNKTLLRSPYLHKIVDAFPLSQEIDSYSRLFPLAEIEKNDFNLNISRYVSTAKQEVAVDLSATHKELVEIEKQIQESTAKHNAFLKELGLSPLPAPDQ